MSLNFNKALIAGRITNDLELKKTESGKSVLSFSVAYNRGNGENAQTTYLNIVAWEKTAEFISKYFHKASPIFIDGEITVRSYEDSNGQKRYVTEIVARQVYFVESKATEGGSAPTETFIPIANGDELPF